MKATNPVSCVRLEISSSSRGHIIFTLAIGPYLENSIISACSSMSRGKLPTKRLVEFFSSLPREPRRPPGGGSTSRPSSRASSRSRCFAIISPIKASIALGLDPLPLVPGAGVVPSPASVDRTSPAPTSASGSSISDAGNAGAYTLPRPLVATSSPGREPAPCTPALTKVMPLLFLASAKLSSKSPRSLAASAASRLRFSSSSSFAFWKGVFFLTTAKLIPTFGGVMGLLRRRSSRAAARCCARGLLHNRVETRHQVDDCCHRRYTFLGTDGRRGVAGAPRSGARP